MERLRIDELEPRDVPELGDLLSLWKPGKSASLGRAEQPNLPATLARLDGHLVGFLTGHHRFRDWAALADHHDLAGTDGSWLAGLFVHPAHRRAGIGAALVGHFVDASAAAGCSMVVVRPDESDAVSEQQARQAFFAAQGFEVLRLDPTVRFLPQWLMGRPTTAP